MKEKPPIVINIASGDYLWQFVNAGAFSELSREYTIHYLLLGKNWDLNQVERDFVLPNMRHVDEDAGRYLWIQRYLMITMFRYARKARGFYHKTKRIPPKKRSIYYLVSSTPFFQIYSYFMRAFWPISKQLEKYYNEIKPELIIMPSMAADTWTLETISTAKRMNLKTFILINSWDNLVSKGVMPIAPDRLGVWGDQGVKQAIEVQQIPREKIIKLGVARFEMYLKGKKVPSSGQEVRELCGIPEGKKIILFAASAMPFDELGEIEKLDDAISKGILKDIVILYRPHPRMAPRVDERHFDSYGFKHAYFDKQMEEQYNARFQPGSENVLAYIARLQFDYYPKLMSAISGMICPLSTLALEGAMNGIASVLICYSDGKNTWLPPDQMAEFDHVKDILDYPGMVPCYQSVDLLSSVVKLVDELGDTKLKQELTDATEYIVHRDDEQYSARLLSTVNDILSKRL